MQLNLRISQADDGCTAFSIDPKERFRVLQNYIQPIFKISKEIRAVDATMADYWFASMLQLT